VRLPLGCAFLALLLAQVPQPSSPSRKPAEYPAHAKLAPFTLAAEFLGHSFSGPEGMFFTEDYLVVETAFYPEPNTTFSIAHSHFRLRLNNSKVPLLSQPPQFVAASLKYEDWTRRPNLTAAGGIGDAGIIIGAPRQTERFPGDPRPQQRRLPNPPQAPTHEDRSGVDKAPPADPAQICIEQSLAEGEFTAPLRGYLYFPWPGKLKSLKKVELLYRNKEQTASLTLR